MVNLQLSRIYNVEPVAFDEIFEKAVEWGKFLAPYVDDVSLVLHKAMESGKLILLEGAQGALLDIDHGTYPFVTSSNPVSAGACVGVGIAPTDVSRVIGVVKAYCTRVGTGPFPTEDKAEIGNALREKGGEFGATTGRPRRCGWLDLVALKFSTRINGMGAIALTKLDVLTGFDEIKICTAYKMDGKEVADFSSNVEFLEEVEPVYTVMKGWSEDISSCRSFEDLPQTAQKYVRFIEEKTGVPVSLIGVGPGREETILRGL